MLTPLTVRVLPVPAFLLAYTTVPPERVSPENSVPLPIVTVPAPVVLPSYTLLTLSVVNTKFALLIVAVGDAVVPPLSV